MSDTKVVPRPHGTAYLRNATRIRPDAWFWECTCGCAFGPLLFGEYAREAADKGAAEHDSRWHE